MHPLLILLIAVIAVFLLIIRFKINAFVSLVLSAILIGILSPNVPLGEVISEVTTRLGSVAGRIAVAISMAALIGYALMESGAADKITRAFIRWFGDKYSSFSMVASGYVLSIPVFHDTVFYLLIPLARAMTIRNGGKRYVLNALAISAGGSATHVFVPPTPGPLAMAALLNIDIGLVIIVGLAISTPAALAAWAYAAWIDRRLNIDIREAPGASLEELEKIAARPESELPSFGLSMLPIVLPVVLITGNTVANTFFKESSLAHFLAFWGNANVALILSAACALWVMARQKGYGLAQLAIPAEKAIKDGGLIILITAGGGAFGGMLVAAGVGDVLSEFANSQGISLMVLGYGTAMMLRVAQGSATVAMITVSAILGPIILQSPPDYNPVYLLMATGGGSITGGWMNDSGFWVFRTMTGLTEIEALKTKSAALSIMGTTGFLCAWLASFVFPMV